MYDRQLLTFIAVAETGSLSRAAEQLYLTGAAVMKQMNALEARLGVKLFERGSRGVRLTGPGRYIYSAAKKLIAEADDAVEHARGMERQGVRTIRVGSSFLNPGQVLIDLWNRVSPDPASFSIRLVPYSDSREQILSVVSSLGSSLDFMVGVFGSRRMLALADFTELGRYALCVAVPRKHPLASRERLQVTDLYGEGLVIVREGDEVNLGELRNTLRREHPQIELVDTDYFYDLETFNECEQSGSLLLTFDAWSGVHPSLVTLPVNWPFTAPYGLLYSRESGEAAREFLSQITSALSRPEN